jgi:hypothetical protein
MAETQIAPIPFNASQDQSASELAGAMPTVVNAIMDRGGVARRRPAIKTWSTFPSASASGSPVVGMCPFGSQLVYVTEDRKLHAVSSVSGVIELSSTDTATMLDGSGRPVMIAGRNMMVVAGGGAIQKWEGTGLAARLTNTGTEGDPPEARSICAVAQRLIAQPPDDSGDFWWSAPLEQYEYWDMALGEAGYTQASAKPDPITIIADNTNEVFAFGKQTLQVYAPASLSIDDVDPTNTARFAPSRTQNLGTITPYSVVSYDDFFAMLDRMRRFLLADGRTYEDISKPVAHSLREMTSIEDCWGFRLKFGRFDSVVWVFPTDGYGLMWDSNQQNWGEWRDNHIDSTSGLVAEQPIRITSAYNWSELGVFLVGLSDGSIAQLDESVNTDLGDPICIKLISGFQNHGSMAQKACRTLMLQFKRTQTALPAVAPLSLSPSGHVRVWYRDYEGAWEFVQDIELSDDMNPGVQIRSLGVYRTRQWKVEYTGADELQFVSAQEEFEILGA